MGLKSFGKSKFVRKLNAKIKKLGANYVEAMNETKEVNTKVYNHNVKTKSIRFLKNESMTVPSDRAIRTIGLTHLATYSAIIGALVYGNSRDKKKWKKLKKERW